MNKALKHIIDQMDENKDGLISYDEYLKVLFIIFLYYI